MVFALAIYAFGVAIGLILTDASPLARTVIALLWPLGAVAFVITIAILVMAAMLIFPVFGVLVVAAALSSWLWFS